MSHWGIIGSTAMKPFKCLVTLLSIYEVCLGIALAVPQATFGELALDSEETQKDER